MDDWRRTVDDLLSSKWLSGGVHLVNRGASLAWEKTHKVVDRVAELNVFKTARRRREELLASWRWSKNSLVPGIRLPIPTDTRDERFILLMLEAARTLGVTLYAYPGRDLLQPATWALVATNVGVFLKPGACHS